MGTGPDRNDNVTSRQMLLGVDPYANHKLWETECQCTQKNKRRSQISAGSIHSNKLQRTYIVKLLLYTKSYVFRLDAAVFWLQVVATISDDHP